MDSDDLVGTIMDASGGGVHTSFDTTSVPSVILKVLAATRMTGRAAWSAWTR
jgi:hypothetical protein